MRSSLRPAFDRLRQYQKATLTTRAALNRIAPLGWKNAMSIQHLRLFLVAGLIALPIALLSLPGAQWPTLFGAASAQEPLDIDYSHLAGAPSGQPTGKHPKHPEWLNIQNCQFAKIRINEPPTRLDRRSMSGCSKSAIDRPLHDWTKFRDGGVPIFS